MEYHKDENLRPGEVTFLRPEASEMVAPGIGNVQFGHSAFLPENTISRQCTLGLLKLIERVSETNYCKIEKWQTKG